MNIKVNKINHLINTLGYSEAFKYLKQIPVKSIDNSILKIYLTVCKNICEHEFAFGLLERLKNKFGNDLSYLYQKALFFKDYGFILKSIQILNFIRNQKICFRLSVKFHEATQADLPKKNMVPTSVSYMFPASQEFFK